MDDLGVGQQKRKKGDTSMFSSLFRPKRPNIASLKNHKDIKDLIKALKYPDKCVAWSEKHGGYSSEEYAPVVFGAAMALAEICDKVASGPIVDALITNGYLLPDNNIAVPILAKFGKDAVEPLLKALVVAKGSRSKELIASILGCIGDERAVNPLILHGEGGSKIWALGQVGGGVETVKFLMRYLVDDNFCDQQFFGIETPTRAFGYGKFGKEAADLLTAALDSALSSHQAAKDSEKSRCARKVAKIAEALCELHDSRGMEVMLRMWGKSLEFRPDDLPKHETLYVISKFQDSRVTSLLVSTVEKYTDGDFRKKKDEVKFEKWVEYHRAFYAALGLLENGNVRGVPLLVDVAATDTLKRYVNYFSPQTYPEVAKKALMRARSTAREALTAIVSPQDEEVRSVVSEILDGIGTGIAAQGVQSEGETESV